MHNDHFTQEPQPENCPLCSKQFEVLDSIHFYHYLDQAFGVWVTHWRTEAFEFCESCGLNGNPLSKDEFETPRFLDEVSIALWEERCRVLRKIVPTSPEAA